MELFILLVGGVVSFLTALLLVPQVARAAIHFGWVDKPDKNRKVHHKITPRAGGLAVIGAMIAGATFFALFFYIAPFEVNIAFAFPSLGLVLGSLVIVVTGLYDDAGHLRFNTKFLIQVIVSFFMFISGYRVDVTTVIPIIADFEIAAALSFVLTVVWFVGVINAVNLIDGLDGLASGVSLIAFSSLTAIFCIQGNLAVLPLFVVFAGATLGFLVYNYNPASIFLGDSGSLFLGFLLATYALESKIHENSILALIIASMAIGFPILDTATAFLRRIIAGRSPFYPDRDHIHHRLLYRMGLSTKQSVLTLYGFNIVLGCCAILVYVIDGYTLHIISANVLFLFVFLRSIGFMRFRTFKKYVYTRVDRVLMKRSVRRNKRVGRDELIEKLSSMSEEEIMELADRIEQLT